MICFANAEIRKFVEFINIISKPDIPAVELYVIPGYDVIETPEGEMGFAVYETETKRIVVPEGVTEEVKETVLASIAHEYYHHIESVRGKEHDEAKAEEYANYMVSAYKAGKGGNCDDKEMRRTWELKPCECGGKGVVINHLNPYHDMVWGVKCQSCGKKEDESTIQHLEDYQKLKYEKSWDNSPEAMGR